MTEKTTTAIATVNKEATKYLQAMGLATKLTAPETEQFLEICKAYQLNPFKREIYGLKYGNQFSIIVGFETYLKRAERTEKLAGWNVTTQGSIKNGDLRATITIHRHDFKEPFIHDVWFVEYNQNSPIWKSKPITMIKKVAMSQGFRLCFSDEIGGMPYTAEEIATEDIIHEEIESRTKTTEQLSQALKEMDACSDIECLKTIWSKYKKLQKNVDFLNAKESKKAEIAEAEEEAQSGKIEVINENTEEN